MIILRLPSLSAHFCFAYKLIAELRVRVQEQNIEKPSLEATNINLTEELEVLKGLFIKIENDYAILSKLALLNKTRNAEYKKIIAELTDLNLYHVGLFAFGEELTAYNAILFNEAKRNNQNCVFHHFDNAKDIWNVAVWNAKGLATPNFVDVVTNIIIVEHWRLRRIKIPSFKRTDAQREIALTGLVRYVRNDFAHPKKYKPDDVLKLVESKMFNLRFNELNLHNVDEMDYKGAMGFIVDHVKKVKAPAP